MNRGKDIIEKIDNAQQFVNKQVNNSFLYSALATNLIERSGKKDYDISRYTKIRIGLHLQDHRLTKKEFKLWAAGFCLTIILEAFNYYVKEITKYVGGYISENRKYELEKINNTHEKFKVLISAMNESYCQKVPLNIICNEQIEAIYSIRKARNSIVHNFGMVDEQILSESSDIFELKWFYIKDYFALSDGTKKNTNKVFRNKKQIISNWSGFDSYAKCFRKGSTINITPYELYRIGIFIRMLTSCLNNNCKLLIQYDYPDNIIIIGGKAHTK